MDEFLSLSISLHVGFIYAALGIAILNVFLLKGDKAKKRFMAFLPLYYTVLSILIFTGAVLCIYIQNWIFISLMIIAWCFILVTCIKCYKLAKKQQSFDEKTLALVRKKFYIDIAIYAIFIIYELI